MGEGWYNNVADAYSVGALGVWMLSQKGANCSPFPNTVLAKVRAASQLELLVRLSVRREGARRLLCPPRTLRGLSVLCWCCCCCLPCALGSNGGGSLGSPAWHQHALLALTGPACSAHSSKEEC